MTNKVLEKLSNQLSDIDERILEKNNVSDLLIVNLFH